MQNNRVTSRPSQYVVTPAKAGVYGAVAWMPAFAGMTKVKLLLHVRS
jgi:hypothetical protein